MYTFLFLLRTHLLSLSGVNAKKRVTLLRDREFLPPSCGTLPRVSCIFSSGFQVVREGVVGPGEEARDLDRQKISKATDRPKSVVLNVRSDTRVSKDFADVLRSAVPDGIDGRLFS